MTHCNSFSLLPFIASLPFYFIFQSAVGIFFAKVGRFFKASSNSVFSCKGSKDKKVLEHGLDQCPAYGYYRDLTLQEITNRIDWMIKKGYLEIEYDYRLPMLVFSEKGWEIERETYAEELLQKLRNLLGEKDYSFVQELKNKNRGMILLLIEKIRQTGNARFIPLLKAWKEFEYKKVQAEIQRVIDYLVKEGKIF